MAADPFVRGRQRGAWRHAIAPAIVVVAALVTWLLSRADASASAGASPAELSARPPAAGPRDEALAVGRASLPAGPLNDAARQAALLQARQRLARAEQTLAAYEASTRYPYGSRPAAEHADQMNPHAPIANDMPLRMPRGAPAQGLHVHTTQERVFVSGSDSSLLTVSVVDDNGTPVPMRIVRSIAHEPDAPSPRALPAPPSPVVVVPFSDDGSVPDAAAGDGVYSAALAPSTMGFAAFPGTIRTELTLQVGDQQGYVAFDVVYAPNQPATWTGRTREALEDGSLNLYLGATVQQPGRYVITGRVDDANGKPFALVSFNDELGAGAREVKLTVFGRLVRDQKPAFPLTLRDVDGFLLKQDTYPDRDLVPRLDGPVLTTKRYAPALFSDAVWNSEEKQRYVAEYQRDIDAAQQGVGRLAGSPGPDVPVAGAALSGSTAPNGLVAPGGAPPPAKAASGP